MYTEVLSPIQKKKNITEAKGRSRQTRIQVNVYFEKLGCRAVVGLLRLVVRRGDVPRGRRVDSNDGTAAESSR